jgi:hypothetical protein
VPRDPRFVSGVERHVSKNQSYLPGCPSLQAGSITKNGRLHKASFFVLHKMVWFYIVSGRAKSVLDFLEEKEYLNGTFC